MSSRRPLLVHVTTTDISLTLLLGPQLRAFAAAGYEVVGVSAAGPHVEQLETWGIRHIALRHATRAIAFQQDILALAELFALFRRLCPDVVHTHNPKPGIYGRLAARAARVPAIVNTVHGLYAVPEDRWAKRAAVYSAERIAAMCSHAELVQNPEDIDTLLRVGVARSKLRLLGNGVDLSHFDPDLVTPERALALRRDIGIGPDDLVCLLVGRLVAEKGFREVFAAANLLRAPFPRLHFVVVGPADDAKSDALTEAELRRANLDGAVHLLGFRADVRDLYGASDLFMLASHREGFPRAAMEAASMGLPIVATNIRGCRQVVAHGVTGLLVPARDPRALAEAVARLAADPRLRGSMARAAKAKAAREFDQAHVIDTTMETYERLRSTRAEAMPA